jgi:hypothetical protein
VAYICNHSTQEAEARGWREFKGNLNWKEDPVKKGKDKEKRKRKTKREREKERMKKKMRKRKK